MTMFVVEKENSYRHVGMYSLNSTKRQEMIDMFIQCKEKVTCTPALQVGKII
jgi:hypothetical protein